jgi:antitoxin ParD1/3/4
MKIELAEDQRRWIELEVAAGRFSSPEDAIAFAFRQGKLHNLRAIIAESIAAGGEHSLEDVMASVEAKAEQLAKEGY